MPARDHYPHAASLLTGITGRRDAARGPSVTPIDTALLRLQLLDALATVSAEHRGVVLRTVLRDRSYRDVAAELELPVGTVRSRAHYALRGLRRSLERADLAA